MSLECDSLEAEENAGDVEVCAVLQDGEIETDLTLLLNTTSCMGFCGTGLDLLEDYKKTCMLGVLCKPYWFESYNITCTVKPEQAAT